MILFSYRTIICDGDDNLTKPELRHTSVAVVRFGSDHGFFNQPEFPWPAHFEYVVQMFELRVEVWHI